MLARQRITLALAVGLLAVVTFHIEVAARPAADADRDKDIPAVQPLPAAQWRRSLLRSSQQGSETARWLQTVEKKLRGQGEPVLVPFTPVAVSSRPKGEGEPANAERLPLLIYRSQWGIHAANITTGTLEWETPSKWSLDGMYMSPTRSQAITSWMTFYLAAGQQPGFRPAMLLENSVVGTLSHDTDFLYVIEDLQMPPPTAYLEFGGRLPGQIGQFGAEVKDALRHSRLQAFEIATGKLKWELGDPACKDELSQCLFTGLLPSGGQAYAITRREAEPTFAARFANPAYAFGPVKSCFWRTELVGIDPKAAKPVARETLVVRPEARLPIWLRIRAAHLVAVKDIFVCFTDVGAVIAVDRATGKTRWQYHYREEADDRNAASRNPPEELEDLWRTRFPPWSGPWWWMYPWWRNSRPAVDGNRLVFTPSFSTAIHCIDVRDGKPLWQAARDEDDLYLAGVVADTVLVVGKKSLRGLRLANGEKAWEIRTEMPCGYGAVRDGIYYLPIEAEPRGKASEILAIDIAAAKMRARFRSADDHPVGSLFFFGDQMVSQSIREIAAYPLPQLGAAPE
jgi:outer membrane protein assembly factor BamB